MKTLFLLLLISACSHQERVPEPSHPTANEIQSDLEEDTGKTQGDQYMDSGNF